MKRFRSICLTVVVGLLVAGIVLHAPRALGAEYTARALIEVLPYADKDPFVLKTPRIDKDLQYHFRLSIATLMTTQGNFEALLKRDAVRKTTWYKQKAGNLAGGLGDLQKNLQVVAQEKGDFVEVAMTCDNAREAADITNEMVTMFISSQGDLVRANITGRLKELKVRESRIQEDLRTAEKALDDVRKAWNLTDLDEHDYPPPFTVRLIRLEEVKDELALEIKGLEVAVEYIDKAKKNSEDQKLELAVLRGKYIEAERLRQEAQLKHKDFDMARVQYAQRVKIRDERMKMLDEVKMLIEKLTILYEDPDTLKLRRASEALMPLSYDP